MPTWTPEQYNEHLLRNAPAVRQPSPEDAVERESDLHEQIQDFCNSQWPRWKYRHARLDRPTTEELGVEDFTLFLPKNVTLHVELKARGKKQTLAQLSWQKELEMLEHPLHLIYSYAEFLKLVKEHYAGT